MAEFLIVTRDGDEPEDVRALGFAEAKANDAAGAIQAFRNSPRGSLPDALRGRLAALRWDDRTEYAVVPTFELREVEAGPMAPPEPEPAEPPPLA